MVRMEEKNEPEQVGFITVKIVSCQSCKASLSLAPYGFDDLAYFEVVFFRSHRACVLFCVLLKIRHKFSKLSSMNIPFYVHSTLELS